MLMIVGCVQWILGQSFALRKIFFFIIFLCCFFWFIWCFDLTFFENNQILLLKTLNPSFIEQPKEGSTTAFFKAPQNALTLEHDYTSAETTVRQWMHGDIYYNTTVVQFNIANSLCCERAKNNKIEENKFRAQANWIKMSGESQATGNTNLKKQDLSQLVSEFFWKSFL